MKDFNKGLVWGIIGTVAVFKAKQIIAGVQKFVEVVKEKYSEAKTKAELEIADELENVAEAARQDANSK